MNTTSVLETILPPQAYFSIGEVSQLTLVKPYVIRYWESQFGALRPPRRESGQRKFTQKEVNLILRIKDLLHGKRFTIAGAKRILQQEARRHSTSRPEPVDMTHATPSTLVSAEELSTRTDNAEAVRAIRKELEESLRLLKGF